MLEPHYEDVADNAEPVASMENSAVAAEPAAPEEILPEQVAELAAPEENIPEQVAEQEAPEENIPEQVAEQGAPEENIPEQVAELEAPEEIIPEQVAEVTAPEEIIPEQVAEVAAPEDLAPAVDDAAAVAAYQAMEQMSVEDNKDDNDFVMVDKHQAPANNLHLELGSVSDHKPDLPEDHVQVLADPVPAKARQRSRFSFQFCCGKRSDSPVDNDIERRPRPRRQ